MKFTESFMREDFFLVQPVSTLVTFHLGESNHFFSLLKRVFSLHKKIKKRFVLRALLKRFQIKAQNFPSQQTFKQTNCCTHDNHAYAHCSLSKLTHILFFFTVTHFGLPFISFTTLASKTFWLHWAIHNSMNEKLRAKTQVYGRV